MNFNFRPFKGKISVNQKEELECSCGVDDFEMVCVWDHYEFCCKGCGAGVVDDDRSMFHFRNWKERKHKDYWMKK